MRHTSLSLALAGALFALTAGSASAALTDGVYSVEAKGNNGPIDFAVTLKDGRIAAIDVKSTNETPGLGIDAVAALSKDIIATQSLAVDGVSGATISSEALKTAVREALKQAGGSEADLKSVKQTPKQAALPINNETEILVVGAGGAGMTAAIAAVEAGAKVLLIEKMPFVGGTTLLSSTAVNAGGSSVQMKAEKPYTKDDYIKKLSAGLQQGDRDAMLQLAELSGPTVDWMIGMGADLSRVINGSQHTPEDGGALGASLVPVLKKRIDALNIETRTGTTAVDLIVGENGRVSSVHVKCAAGEYDIKAKAVILATGGFASNPEYVKRFTPQWAGYPSTASVGVTGDAIRMTEKLGAKLSDMAHAGPQTVAYDTGHGAVSLTNVRYNGAILVNQKGERFFNELGNTAKLGAAIKAQPGGYAYLIFDQASVDHAKLMSVYKDRGYFVEAPSISELAAKFGIKPEALGSTVMAWRQVYDTKEDKLFGRKDSIFSRLDKAPIYGQKISPANQTTYGGIVRDRWSRVVKEDGSVIPGLYVAGEAASQFGQGVTIATVLGRLAGQEAAAEVKTMR